MPVMSLGSVEAIQQLVDAGLGCAVLPSMAIRSDKHRGSLVVRPLTLRLHRTLAIVIRATNPSTAASKRLYVPSMKPADQLRCLNLFNNCGKWLRTVRKEALAAVVVRRPTGRFWGERQRDAMAR